MCKSEDATSGWEKTQSSAARIGMSLEKKSILLLSNNINTSLVPHMAEKSTLKTLDSISSHNPHILADLVKHGKNPAAHNWSKSTLFLSFLPTCTIKDGTAYFKQAESSNTLQT